MVTGRRALAAEAAGLFWKHQIKLGAHRVNWYLSHGWTACAIGRTPLFNPTTSMDAATINVLSRWLGRDSIRDRLARLYLLAGQIDRAVDQTSILDEYERIATTLVPSLTTMYSPAKRIRRACFSLTNAKAALIALKALPTPWYIVSGTFLGAIREGTFLSHDFDIDIGIHAEDFDESAFLDSVSRAADLTLVNASRHEHLTKIGDVWRGTPRPALYRLLHRSGIEIDVFVHYREGDTRWHGSLKHRWDNSEFSLSDITIADITVQGPTDSNRYLAENYGDWRTPVTDFNCATGTPNISFPRNLAAVAEYLRVAILTPCTEDAAIARQVLLQEGYIRDKAFSLPWR
ncbi:MAG: hypothetical protein ABJ370_11345 [Paracoccaceae bacterium]